MPENRVMMRSLALALLVVAGAAAADPLPHGVAGRVAPCDPASADFCGLRKAEDLADVPGTRWILTVQLAGGNAVAPFALLDVGRHVQVPLRPEIDRRSPRADAAGLPDTCMLDGAGVHAAGMSVRRIGRALQVAVIDRGTPERIQLFELVTARPTPRLLWRRCIPVPPPYNLNDVAIGPRGEIYATHMFERPADADAARALREAYLARKPTGFALRWTETTGWSRMAGTDRSFANGIAFAADGTLAIAGTFDQDVLLLMPDGRTRKIPVPLQPDNLTPAPDGGFIAAGHTGVPVTGVDPCRSESALPCGFPFAVARIAPDGSVRVIFEHDGSRIPGASVALVQDGHLLLGSAFGDRIAVVPLDATRK